jgi:photosystem II stability/assembly factor-like uncharacterized protein
MPSIRGAIAAAWLALSAQAAWVPTGPFGGEAEVVRTAPGRAGMAVAAARNGLLYLTVDGGANWTHLAFPAQLAGTLHALELATASTWYAAIEADSPSLSGVYRTTDGGRAWELVKALRGAPAWSLAVWPGSPQVAAAGTTEGVFLTRDGGATWTRITPADSELRPAVSLAFHPTDAGVLYAGTTHLPWRTLNGGAAWQSIPSGMIDDSDVFSIAVDSRAPSRVWASACSGVYASSNGGVRWRRLATPPGAFRTYLVAKHPEQADVLFAATSAGLLRSENAGASWRRISPHRVKSIAFDPAAQGRVYFASSAGVLISRDSGRTLTPARAGYANRTLVSLTAGDDALYAVATDARAGGELLRYSSGAWREAATPVGGIERVAAAPDHKDRLYGASRVGVFESPDGGGSWRRLPDLPGKARVTAIEALAGGVVLAGADSGLFRRAGSGVWTKIDAAGAGVTLLDRAPGGVAAAVTARGAFRGEAEGVRWTACGAPAPGAVWYALAFDLDVTGAALAATSRGLFRSLDRCATWTAVAGEWARETVTAARFHPTRRGEAFVAHYGRILRSVDGGRTWRPLDEAGRNHLYPSALAISAGEPDRLIALFPRRGVMFQTISGAQPTIP